MPKRQREWDDGSGFRIPIAQWQPESKEIFLDRCESTMGKWRRNNFQQQGMQKTRSDKRATQKPLDPQYTIDFDRPEYDWRGASVTYSLVPNASLTGRFQDGSEQRGETIMLHHSTRDCWLASIFRDGLETAGHSHVVTACWFRDVEEESNFDWGLTPLDFLNGCYISVVADAEKVRQRRRLGEDRTRAVVEGLAHSVAIPVRCAAVTFRIPSPDLEKWREDMQRVCRQSIDMHGHFLGPAAKTNASKSLWGLLQHRLCYDKQTWDKGRWKRVHVISRNMAHEVSAVLRAILVVTNLKKRRNNLRAIVWQKLPVPFQVFLQSTYAGCDQVRDFFQQDESFDASTTLWVKELTDVSSDAASAM